MNKLQKLFISALLLINSTAMSQQLSFEQAQKIAILEMDKIADPNHEIVLWEQNTITHKHYWAFVFATKKYIETRNENYMIPGLPSIIVEKDGTISKTASSVSPSLFFEHFDEQIKIKYKLIGSWEMTDFVQGKDGFMFRFKKVKALPKTVEGYVFNADGSFFKQGCDSKDKGKTPEIITTKNGKWKSELEFIVINWGDIKTTNYRIDFSDDKMTIVFSKIDN